MDAHVYGILADRLARGLDGVLATVVLARGSTPQRPGAKAIFTPEGGVLGTIGGGCLEADAQRRALDVLADRRPALLTIQLNHDFDQDSGLICGGTAKILLVPASAEQRAPAEAVAAAYAAGVPAAAAITVETPGDDLGALLAVTDEGATLGDAALIDTLRDALARRVGGLVEAGERTLYIDLVTPRPRLWIAGAGHVGRALARHASACEFEVTVVDDRGDLNSPDHIPWAEHHLVGDIAELLGARDYGPEDYIVIVTRGHRHDGDALRAVLRSGAAYLGLIGSRRKIKLIGDGLQEEGSATADELARVYAPIGLDIGAVTVDEIAVCITAELIAVRRGKLTEPGQRLARTGGSGAGCFSGVV